MLNGIHIFDPYYFATECSTEVSFSTPGGAADGEKFLLCLKVSIPG